MGRTKIGSDKSKTMKRLPHELIVEILSWLPVKHLYPFRYVCKTWLQLISRDPHFAKLHLDRSMGLRTNPSIIAKRTKSYRFYLATDHTTCDNSVPLELPFEQEAVDYPVYGICNGLLCLSSICKAEVYIWNPITNGHITIPYSPTPSPCPVCEGDTQFAFGCHPSTSEYKVIQIFRETDCVESKSHSQISVYTLGADSSWRTVVEDMPYNISTNLAPHPLVNGAVHWFGTGSSSLHAIVAFDLKDEFFQEVPPPENFNIDDRLSSTSLGEFGGQLCIFCRRFQEGIQIWVMQEYGVANSWTRLLKFGLSEVGNFFTDISPLCVLAYNDDILMKKSMTELILYHSETGSISPLKDFGFKIYGVYTCIGSIISPKLISGARDIMT